MWSQDYIPGCMLYKVKHTSFTYQTVGQFWKRLAAITAVKGESKSKVKLGYIIVRSKA